MKTAASSQQPAALAIAIQKLYEWQYRQRNPEDFSFQLFTLMQVANPDEFARLALSYPAESEAYKLWYSSPDPIEFFKTHGVWAGPRA